MLRPLAFALASILLHPLAAQNLVPDGEFDAGGTSWTQLGFNDPLGSTGFGQARVSGNGPSTALFANFQTLTSVMAATWRSAPFTLQQATYPVGFQSMWEKQVTTPIPYPSVNRVELRVYDANNVRVLLVTLQSPNQTGLQERASYTGTFAAPAAGSYTAELYLRHSNLAGIPFTNWVDDLYIGGPNAFVFGQGCAGSGGTTPVINSVNVPAVNSTNFAIELHDAYAPTVAFFAMDLSRTSYGGLSLPYALGGGCDLLVGLTVFQSLAVAGSGAGQGTASQTLPIPNLPGLAGVQCFCQWAVVDPAATNPYGVAMTAGLGFTVQ